MFNLAGRTVGVILKRNNIEIRFKPNSPKPDKKEINKIIQAYKQGGSIKSISIEFRRNQRTIKALLIKNNVELRAKPSFKTKLNKNQKDDALNLYNQGSSIIRISRVFKTSYNIIHAIILENHKLRNEDIDRVKPTNEEIREIINLSKKRASVPDLASIFVLSKYMVRKILKDNDVSK